MGPVRRASSPLPSTLSGLLSHPSLSSQLFSSWLWGAKGTLQSWAVYVGGCVEKRACLITRAEESSRQRGGFQGPPEGACSVLVGMGLGRSPSFSLCLSWGFFSVLSGREGPCQGTVLGCHTWEGSFWLGAGAGGRRGAASCPPCFELREEALALLGLRQFSCLHYFFL